MLIPVVLQLSGTHSGTAEPPVGLPTLDLGIPGLPSLPFPLPPFTPPSLLPLPRGPHPLNQLGGVGECCELPSGVWCKSPAKKRFGAYLSQNEQLWWKQCLCIFIRINLNFCTNTRLLTAGRIMTISLVSDITIKSSQVVCD